MSDRLTHWVPAWREQRQGDECVAVRAMFSIGGVDDDVLARAVDWPPAITTARGLRWAIDHPHKLVLNGSRQMVIDR